ncbi:hypothetical protein F4811DRAFT_519707 [Daldinia bambusicola]|nr:hypothetical protein F4811DRAFT_519707 [Daldinia bambusicola]
MLCEDGYGKQYALTDGEPFGVQFLFTTFGVVISFFWAWFFSSIVMLNPIPTISLDSIPYQVTQTLLLHQVCTWSALGILCIMMLVVVASFLITWPHIPYQP